MTELNTGDDTIGDVRYTNLYTALDELVRPVANAALRDGATNVLIQSQCPLRVVAPRAGPGRHRVRRRARRLLGRPVRLNCFAV